MKKLTCIMLVISIVFALFSFSASANSYEQIDESLYYAKAELSKLANGEALINAYNKIAAGVAANEVKIDLSDDTLPITPEELSGVFDAFRCDQPQYFHLTSGYSTYYNPDTNVAVAIEVTYSMDADEYAKAKVNFNKAANKILAKVPENASEYDTELAIHDALARHIEYTHGATDEHDAYGALVYSKAVCDGYAKAFQYLLQRRGIQALVVEGVVLEEDGSTSGHAWNIVRIDGNYYHTDLTHDDPLSSTKPKVQVYHNYFNITTERMLRDRALYETAYPIPECTATDAFYFNQEGNLIDAYSIAEVAEKLAEGNGVAHIFAGTDTTYHDWYLENFAQIYSLTGIKNASSYSCSYLDGEFILSIICPSDINVDGSVNSSDALLLKQGLIGIHAFSEANVINGDTNQNGVIDSLDYLNLKMILISQ